MKKKVDSVDMLSFKGKMPSNKSGKGYNATARNITIPAMKTPVKTPARNINHKGSKAFKAPLRNNYKGGIAIKQLGSF